MHYTKNETSIKEFFSKSDQIQWKLQIWLHLQKKKYLANGKLHFLFSVGSFARKQNHTLNFHESGRTFSGITHMAKITYRYSPKLLT